MSFSLKGILLLILILFLSIRFLIPYLIRRRNRKLLLSVTDPDRGTSSERDLIILLRKRGIPPQAIYHDLYLPKRNGGYSQIDVVVMLPQGLLVIEVKDYSGWIYGEEYQKYWSQLLQYGQEKHHFYNPLFQNAGHIRTLRGQSWQMAHLPIFNVVLFTDGCTLKDIQYEADNTFVGYLHDIRYVLKRIRKSPEFSYRNENEIVNILRQAVVNGCDPDIIATHIESVQKTIAEQNQPYLIRKLRAFFRMLRFFMRIS